MKKKKCVSLFCLCDEELKWPLKFMSINLSESPDRCNAMIRVVLCQSEEAGVNEW